MKPLGQTSESLEAAIFEAAHLCVTPAQRAAYLDRACDGKPELRQRLDQLLLAHDETSAFLDNPNIPNPVSANPMAGATVRLAFPVEEKPGTVIGRYKLLQKIGEGGCGTVYMAEQETPVKRRVALKIIKLGMDTQQVVARFEAERQALAMMDHPNIAKVFDAGATQTGRPFFVMELVRGIRITDYCDQHNLSTEQRLKLFTPVCQAIQHAHQKGIIHRDIKPSNIMVTLHDGVPVPKVIDFGIAKATQGRLTDHTLFTAYEQFIGTPAYMSPEQAEMSGLDIDTRTDIYSLGVLLYELLTGRTPFDPKELLAVGLEAMRKTIREKEPQRPSTRLSSLEAEALTTTAAHRHIDAPTLIHLIRADLDWIVMKALEKDRTRRYETANGLAMDVLRYLKDEPIVARPPSRLYRLKKSIRRNRVAFGAATLIIFAIVAGAVLSLVQAAEAQRARRAAQMERDAAAKARQQSEVINRFLTEDLLFQATPEQTERQQGITMEQVLHKAAQRLDQNVDLHRQAEVEASLRIALGVTFRKLGLYPEAERQLRLATELRRRELGENNLDTLLAQSQLVSLLLGALNRFDDETEKLSQETWQSLHRLLDSQTNQLSATNLYRAMLDGESDYIWALTYRGQVQKAVSLKRTNAACYEKLFGPFDQDSINERHNLALVLTSNGDFAEAEQNEKEALKRYAQLGQSDTFSAFTTIAGLAACRFFQNDPRGAEILLVEALPRATRVLGAEHPATLHLKSYLARVLAEKGELDKARDLARETMLARRRILGTNSLNTAYTTLILGRVLVKQGQLDEAISVLEDARATFRNQLSKVQAFAAEAENWLGAIQLTRKNYTEAEALLLAGAEHLLAPGAFLSARERNEAVGHLIELYQRVEKPDRASYWQRRLDESAR